MAIEHIQFLNCDACGSRFRDHGQGRVGSRMLCDKCRAEYEEALGEAPVTSGEEGDLVADIERTLAELESGKMADSFAPGPEAPPGLDDPSVGAGETSASVAEIAARLGSAPRPQLERRTHERDWELRAKGKRDDLPRSDSALRRWRWPLYGGLALSVIAGTAVTLWRLRVRGQNLKVQPVVQWRDPASATIPVPDLPAYEEARELALRFATEPDPDAVLEMIRTWPGCREDVAAFLAENPPVGPAEEMLSDMPPVIRPDIVYQSFGLLLPSGIGRLIQVVESDDGPKVDFKAYVEWCSVPPESLLRGELDHADEVRAILRPSTYYNFEFSDSEKYLALSATLAGQREQLMVYVARDSPEAQDLARSISQIGMHPATFSLQAVGESHKHQQFLLSELLAIGFVVPAKGGE